MSTSAPPHTVSFLEKIDSGVELLNELYPGWLDDMTDDLDLSNSTTCVLGRAAIARGLTYDDAVRHIVAVGLAEHEADAQLRYGFAIPHLSLVNWGEATAMWREKISALREARPRELILAA